MSALPIPAPLPSGHLCPECGGTGADRAATVALHRRGGASGYIRCWNCNGNGLDPAAYFNWGTSSAPATASS